MILPLLISLLMLYIPLPFSDWTWPWHWTLGGVALVAGMNGLACWLGVKLAGVRRDSTQGVANLRAARLFTIIRVGIPAFVLLDVFALKWPLFVEQTIGHYRWMILIDDLALLSPALMMMATVMVFRHRLEELQGNVSLSLWKYLWLRFRVEMALILAGWMLLVFFSDLTEAFFHDHAYRDAADVVTSLGILAVVIVMGPLALSFIWSTSRLPDGPLRARLEDLCRAHRFRYRAILVWHTHHHVPNAGVVGLLPSLRYVLLSDALLLHCTHDEVETVFAHEVGHIRHHHLAFYMGFALAFFCFYANLIDALSLTGWVQPLQNMFAFEVTPAQALTMLLFAIAYWVFLFGFLSRRLEQEADLFSLRASRNPAAFISALGKLAEVSHTPGSLGSWRHFSIQHRIAFLRSVMENPALAAGCVARTHALQAVLTALFVLGLLRLLAWRPELFWM